MGALGERLEEKRAEDCDLGCCDRVGTRGGGEANKGDLRGRRNAQRGGIKEAKEKNLSQDRSLFNYVECC